MLCRMDTFGEPQKQNNKKIRRRVGAWQGPFLVRATLSLPTRLHFVTIHRYAMVSSPIRSSAGVAIVIIPFLLILPSFSPRYAPLHLI